MNNNHDKPFWEAMRKMIGDSSIRADRPKLARDGLPTGLRHRQGMHAMDDGEVDVWFGSLGTQTLTRILCTFDTLKAATKAKLLLGLTSKQVETYLGISQQHHANPLYPQTGGRS